MKKILAVTASLILVVVSANSQSEKKEPPSPPPPKQIDEKVKFTPPKIVKDEEVNSSTKTKTEKSKEKTPPKGDITKFTPPKIVKDEEVQMKELPVITVNGKLADDFYKRNPCVSDISRQGNIITLKMNDGTTEKVKSQFIKSLNDISYPPDYLAEVGFYIDSDENVKTNFEGNYLYRTM